MLNKLFTNKTQQQKFIFDYFFVDKLLRFFTIGWLITRIEQYNRVLQHRNPNLYEPIVWLQKLTMHSQLPNPTIFYTISIIAIVLSILTLYKKSILLRGLLFFLILWINTVKWNFGYLAGTGHLFAITHLFFLFTPSQSKHSIDSIYAQKIQWGFLGLLSTYTLAGIWKYLGLAKSVFFYQKHQVGWLNKYAVEYNTIVSKAYHDETIPEFLFQLYQIPYLWEIATISIFTIQLFSIIGAFSRKLGILIMLGLFSFHFYSWVVNKTEFIVAMLLVVILLFPYHLVLNREFKTGTSS